MSWKHLDNISTRSYLCGYCSKHVASEKGWIRFAHNSTSNENGRIYTCPFCDNPTFFSANAQIPGALVGASITNIEDKSVALLYQEARLCFSVNAFTAVVMTCRKMLMHIAVAKGAAPNLSFIKYVEYFSEKNYIPPGAKEWVDHIREKGNEANHEIVLIERSEAFNLIQFIEMILKIIYEFPSRINKE